MSLFILLLLTAATISPCASFTMNPPVKLVSLTILNPHYSTHPHETLKVAPGTAFKIGPCENPRIRWICRINPAGNAIEIFLYKQKKWSLFFDLPASKDRAFILYEFCPLLDV